MRSAHATAYFLREAGSAAASWTHCLLPATLLAIGLVPVAQGLRQDSAILFLLQALLYLIPLFAIVAGVGSARNDEAENPLLASLPAGAASRVGGKFALHLATFAAAAVALIAPTLFVGGSPGAMLRLWSFSVGISSVFLALGLCVGFRARDGIGAHLAALLVWLIATFGFGLLAHALAGTAWAGRSPEAWTGLLAISPLDNLRVATLLSVEAVPFDRQGLPSLARAWLDNAEASFAAVAAFWTAAALAASRPRRQ